MSKISSQVQNRIKVTDYVLSSLGVNGASAATELAEEIDELDAATVRKVLDGVAAYLGRRADTLRQTEHDYTAEQADDPPLRNARDKAASVLIDTLGYLRDLIVEGFGREGAGRYGFVGETPRVPSALAEHGSNVVSLLRKHPATARGRFDTTVDTKKAADQLEPVVEALTSHLSDVDREVRELQTALVERDKAVAKWTTDYRGAGAVIEGFYRLAGKGELADQIRPTARRASGQSTDIEDDNTIE